MLPGWPGGGPQAGIPISLRQRDGMGKDLGD